MGTKTRVSDVVAEHSESRSRTCSTPRHEQGILLSRVCIGCTKALQTPLCSQSTLGDVLVKGRASTPHSPRAINGIWVARTSLNARRITAFLKRYSQAKDLVIALLRVEMQILILAHLKSMGKELIGLC